VRADLSGERGWVGSARMRNRKLKIWEGGGESDYQDERGIGRRR